MSKYTAIYVSFYSIILRHIRIKNKGTSNQEYIYQNKKLIKNWQKWMHTYTYMYTSIHFLVSWGCFVDRRSFSTVIKMHTLKVAENLTNAYLPTLNSCIDLQETLSKQLVALAYV